MPKLTLEQLCERDVFVIRSWNTVKEYTLEEFAEKMNMPYLKEVKKVEIKLEPITFTDKKTGERKTVKILKAFCTLADGKTQVKFNVPKKNDFEDGDELDVTTIKIKEEETAEENRLCLDGDFK